MPSTSEEGVIQVADDKAEATDGEIPIGTSKINTGQGINNYVPPALPAQGALARLIADQDNHG